MSLDFQTLCQHPGAAGIIHLDFEKGFIPLTLLCLDDLIKYRSEKTDQTGRLREEGKRIMNISRW